MNAVHRPRVVYLDHCAQPSGGEIALVRLVAALQGRVEAHVLLGEDGPIVADLVEAGARVEVLPMAADLRDTPRESVRAGGLPVAALRETGRYVARLRRRLRQLQPDLVHTNSLKSALYGGLAGRAAGLPVLWHVRDRIAPDYLPLPAVLLVRALARVLPSAVVVNSRATAATLPGRSHVLYDVVPRRPPAPARPDTGGSGPTIGMMGRLAPWKGQHVFLRAFAEAYGGEPARARLIGAPLFGEERYADELRRLVEELDIRDQVEFRGFRPDIWEELASLDLLVHASTTPEPFGQVVIEGMAAGLPVVAAASGGPAEVVTDGVDGLLVPPGDHVALAAALRRLGDDAELRRVLGGRGRTTSLAYGPEGIATRMLALYAGLGRHRPT